MSAWLAPIAAKPLPKRKAESPDESKFRADFDLVVDRYGNGMSVEARQIALHAAIGRRNRVRGKVADIYAAIVRSMNV